MLINNIKPSVQVALQTKPTVQPSPPVSRGRFSYSHLSHNQKQLARNVWFGLAAVYANKPLLHPILSQKYIEYIKVGKRGSLRMVMVVVVERDIVWILRADESWF